jgi:hypothetical protein
MASPLLTFAAERAGRRIPYLRRLPIARLIVLGELVLLAKAHIELLTPAERRRLVLLLREARGRPSRLSPTRRAELEELIAKAQPRALLGEAARRLAPAPAGKRRGRAGAGRA